MMTHRRSQHAIGGVDFKINPTLIDSTTITKLDTFTYGTGRLGYVWKCSMSTPSGTRTVSLQTGAKLITYHYLGCCQVLPDPLSR
jgi:hypothetical protein